ncbi:hypothetical protein [Agarilytica rhodophyticola]|uniref:hypothetical protein n=1 Tax=Agarilytica rhodophyticola TaxID=1737490 RepID=UPI000B342B80|nr:hypothetical protein [Agarilytica rhodophyticola]
MLNSGITGLSNFFSGGMNVGRTLQAVTGAVDTNGHDAFRNFTNQESEKNTAHAMKEFARASKVQRNDMTMATDRQIMEKAGGAAKLNF